MSGHAEYLGDDSLPEVPVTIWVDWHFDAAHQLSTLPVGHKCRQMHGHTYHVRLFFRGPVGEAHGWLIDFAAIKQRLAPYFNVLDHKLLNRVKGLEKPTVENIARLLWKRAKAEFDSLVRVEVREGKSQGAICEG